MKKMFVAALLAAAPMCAALPPLAQNIREIEKILGDPAFYHLLGSAEPIEDICRNDKGYRVTTRHYTMQVNIIYHLTGRCGPVDFELVFEPPVAKS